MIIRQRSIINTGVRVRWAFQAKVCVKVTQRKEAAVKNGVLGGRRLLWEHGGRSQAGFVVCYLKSIFPRVTGVEDGSIVGNRTFWRRWLKAIPGVMGNPLGSFYVSRPGACHPPSPPTGIRLWRARKVTCADARRVSPVRNKEKILG